ncbi:hypothetical protein EJB05_30993, partial [Eragrostis curvula]
MAERGVDIRRAIVSTAPRTTLLPSSRPAAIRNIVVRRDIASTVLSNLLEALIVPEIFAGLATFLNLWYGVPTSKEAAFDEHKAENVLRLWWQRSRDHVKNYRSTSSDDPYAKDCRSIHVFGTIGCLAMFSYVVVIIRAIHLHNVGTASQCAMYSTYPYFLLPGYRCVHFHPFDDNFASKERTNYIDEE